MSSMRRVLKKLDRYVCAADVFEIYEDETGIASYMMPCRTLRL